MASIQRTTPPPLLSPQSFRPILYTANQVRLMVRIMRFMRPGANPSFRSFGLQKACGGFVWNPR